MKALIKTPMSHIKVPGFDAVFLMAVSCYCRPWEATVMVQVTFFFFLCKGGGFPTTHLVDLDCVLGFWLQAWASPCLCGMLWALKGWVAEWDLFLWLFPCLSFSQMNLRIIYIFWGPLRCFNICINCDVQCKHIHLIFFIIQSIKILSSSF